MKNILIISVLVAFPLLSFSQNDYWKDYFTVISNVKYGDYEITLEKKLDLYNYRENPDGWRFYRTTLAIGLTISGNKKLNVIDKSIYTTQRYTTAMIPCMMVDYKQNKIFVFSSGKDSDRYYGMEGYIYTIDLNNNSWSKEKVFSRANFGWWSFFSGVDNYGNPQLSHFSYAGYYGIKTEKHINTWRNKNIGRILPKDMGNQYFSHDNILWTFKPNVDEIYFTKSYYQNKNDYYSYNSTPSSITLKDLFATGKILYNLYKVGDAIFNENSKYDTDQILSNIINCSAQNGVSSISNNPFIASCVSNAVNSVIEKKGIDITSVTFDVLENYVIDELKEQGKEDIAKMLEVTSFFECLTNK